MLIRGRHSRDVDFFCRSRNAWVWRSLEYNIFGAGMAYVASYEPRVILDAIA